MGKTFDNILPFIIPVILLAMIFAFVFIEIPDQHKRETFCKMRGYEDYTYVDSEKINCCNLVAGANGWEEKCAAFIYK